MNVPAALADIIHREVLPNIESCGAARLLVAPARHTEFAAKKIVLPPEISLSRRPLRGPRVAVRARRYGRLYHHAARWPNDAMMEVRIPLMIYVAAGAADLRLSDYVLRCPSEYFIVIPPGAPFADDTRSHLEGAARRGGSCELLWLCPLTAPVAGVQLWTCESRGPEHVSQSTPCFALNTAVANCLLTLLEDALNQGSCITPPANDTERSNASLAWRGLLMAFFALLLRDLEAGRTTQQAPFLTTSKSPDSNHDPIAQARDYARSHLTASPKIDDVARHVYLSRTQFTQRFRRETGQSFIEFLTAERLAEAQRLLRETEWSVESIARQVGLTSVHLRELFRRRLQTTPTAFRAQARRSTRQRKATK